MFLFLDVNFKPFKKKLNILNSCLKYSDISLSLTFGCIFYLFSLCSFNDNLSLIIFILIFLINFIYILYIIGLIIFSKISLEIFEKVNKIILRKRNTKINSTCQKCQILQKKINDLEKKLLFYKFKCKNLQKEYDYFLKGNEKKQI